ncbi:stage II sporulation protein E [Bacillus sp. FJAT-44742]|uniref:stage II sporulation protein E n=1 Tax=Bacillus sp. FJAT-44742 TaxID=2014005 RepID=UPI0012FF30D6|nr:stage II sporulation protein E [Bacillus sp. FJAT-44742]
MLQKETTTKRSVDVLWPVKQTWGMITATGKKGKERAIRGSELVFLQWGGLLFIVGVLLGRAVLLAELYPFAIPFFAAVYVWKRNKGVVAAAGILLGTFLGAPFHATFVLGGIILFVLLFEWMKRYSWKTSMSLPISVLLATGLSRLFVNWASLGEITSYTGVMTGVEAGLSFVLTMIFMQSLPLLMTKNRRQPLKHEEIVCFIILLASIMTGAIGWVIYGLAAEHMLARYLVLLFAYIGGAAIGSAVGVVVGLVLSLAAVANLYQIGLLAFAGLLGGLLKEGKKLGVSLGLLLGTALIALYGNGMGAASLTLAESAVAVLLFIFTPKVVTSFLAKYVPGTSEHVQEQQKHAKKIKDVTAMKVEQFSKLFQTLSHSFSVPPSVHKREEEQHEVDLMLSQVTEKTCQTCFKKERCWVNQFNETYESMSTMIEELQVSGGISQKTQGSWSRLCHYNTKVINVMKEELADHEKRQTLKLKVEESRRLVADQLEGVSKIMENFAGEIQKEKENHYWQEERIHDALNHAGVEINHIDIFRLDEGNVEIEMVMEKDEGFGKGEKVIAPMLSDILNEHIVVAKEKSDEAEVGYSCITFVSARTYTVETGIATVAKGGTWVSGDSHSAVDIGSGKFAVAISDGMGNGKRAHEESKATLQLLQTILQSGMDETVAIKSINSILSLRTNEEMFSTLDLAMIDLQDADAKFLKVGSIPSFVKRGSKVFQIEAGNLPMGMLENVEVDVVNEQLKDGDLLIMMSDGIFDVPKGIENKEVWMKRLVYQLNVNKPQEVADLLLEEVIRAGQGEINDDMTIVVAKIKRNIPKWASIPVGQHVNLLRKKAQ